MPGNLGRIGSSHGIQSNGSAGKGTGTPASVGAGCGVSSGIPVFCVDRHAGRYRPLDPRYCGLVLAVDGSGDTSHRLAVVEHSLLGAGDVSKDRGQGEIPDIFWVHRFPIVRRIQETGNIADRIRVQG